MNSNRNTAKEKTGYSDNGVSQYLMVHKFKESCESVEDEPSSGRPFTAQSAAKITEIAEIINN